MAIHVNQVGYFCGDRKTAVFTEGKGFEIHHAEDDSVAFTGTLGETRFDETSGENAVTGDFSELFEPGRYYITDDKKERSSTFIISEAPYRELLRDVLKAFYFQRCGCALDEKYAGIFRHKSCHTRPVTELFGDKTEKYPNGGWHDAGDYGRYSTAAAVALGHMLYAYLLFPEQFAFETNIPESGNGIPDILNECRYELEWLFHMQKEDGSVYHKLTSMRHADFVLPEEDLQEFFFFPVSTQAAADFAGIMALAARVYGKLDAAFAKKAEEAARKAYEWLTVHPELKIENNPEGCNTGSYYDRQDTDERSFAAAELFVLTGEKRYEEDLCGYAKKLEAKTVFGWGDVSGFAGLSILTDPKKQASEGLCKLYKEAFLAECDRLVTVRRNSPYELAMEDGDYTWGSNMTVLNYAMLLSVTARLLREEKEPGTDPADRAVVYHETAVSLVDYLLGKNVLDISYVTGHGERAYRHPHNRPTVALGDRIVMPGWVSGGANRRPADVVAKENLPEGTPPMKCFVDRFECYSLNEITIYWNSLLVFMAAYLQDKNK